MPASPAVSRRRVISRLNAAACSALTAARSVSASNSSARNESATLRKAVSTVDRYCAFDCSQIAIAARRRARFAPPSSSVCTTLPPTSTVGPSASLNSMSNDVAVDP